MGNDYLSGLGQDFLKKLQLDKAQEAAKEKINNDGNLDFNETQELAGSVFSIGEDGTVSVEDSTINNLLSDLGVDKKSADYDQLVEETRNELMTNVQDVVSQNEEQITTEEGQTEYDLIVANYGEYLESIGVDIDDYSADDEDWSAISQIIADANPDLNVAWGEEIPAGTQINLPKIKIDENGKLVQAPDEETSSVNEETKNEYLERIEDLMADKDGIKGTDDDLDMIPDDISVEIDGQTYDKTAIQELFDPANLKNSDISGETIEKIYNVLASGDLDGPGNGTDSMGALKDAISSVVSEYNGEAQNYDGEGIEGFENTTGLIDNGDGTYSVEVQEWGSDALDGNEYANDALSRIIANYYPDVEMYSEEYDKVLEEIMSRNEQITDPNLIQTGDKIELPVPEYDESGAITGFKTPEEVQAANESQESETTEVTGEVDSTEATDGTSGVDGTNTTSTTPTPTPSSYEGTDSAVQTEISDEVKEDLEALGMDPDKVEIQTDIMGNTNYYQPSEDNENTGVAISYNDYGEITKSFYENGNLIAAEYYDENNTLTGKSFNYEDGSTMSEVYNEDGKVAARTRFDANGQLISSETFQYGDDGSYTMTTTDETTGEETTATYEASPTEPTESPDLISEEESSGTTTNPEASTNPGTTTAPGTTTDPGTSSDPEVTTDPGTTDPGIGDEPVTITPGVTIDPGETEADPGLYDPEITGDPTTEAEPETAAAEEDVISDEKAERLAKELHSAMEGWGTDDEAVKNILQNDKISDADLIKIMKNYPGDEGLTRDIQGDFSGKTEDELTSRITDALSSEDPLTEETADLIAKELYQATGAHLGTNEQFVEEMFEKLSPEALALVNERYSTVNEGRTLKEDIKGDFSFGAEDDLIKKLNDATMSGLKSENMTEEQAKQYAQELFNAMDGLGTDEETVESIIENVTPENLVKIMQQYPADSLVRDIQGDFSLGAEDSLISQITDKLTAQDPITEETADVIAKELYQATAAHLGTNEQFVEEIFEKLSPESLSYVNTRYSVVNEERTLSDDIKGDFSFGKEDELLKLLYEADMD